MTDAFLCVKENPSQGIEINFEVFKIFERFTIVMYDKSSTDKRGYELLQKGNVLKKSRSLENLLCTQDALLQHSKGENLQASVWPKSNEPSPYVLSPEE